MRAKRPKLTRLADGVDLWLGDCRALLDHVGEFTAMITDPPYESHIHKAKSAKGMQRRLRTDGQRNPAAIDFSSIDGLREVVVEPLVQLCHGWFIAFCTPEGIAPWRNALKAAGAKYKRACFFCKTDAAPQFNGQGPAFAVEPFVTAWCGKGMSHWNGGGRRNWWALPTNGTDREGTHPTEKPLALMSEIVSLFTSPGDTVFDPFMGSGTTGVACVRSGRKFIGVERDPKYFAVAERRISTALAQADMFVDVPKPLKPVPML